MVVEGLGCISKEPWHHLMQREFSMDIGVALWGLDLVLEYVKVGLGGLDNATNNKDGQRKGPHDFWSALIVLCEAAASLQHTSLFLWTYYIFSQTSLKSWHNFSRLIQWPSLSHKLCMNHCDWFPSSMLGLAHFISTFDIWHTYAHIYPIQPFSYLSCLVYLLYTK